MVFTRREVGALGSDQGLWDPIMEHYAWAIGLMQTRDPDDPKSWQVQAAMHAERCQHANWHFLPWHRMYLFRFEEIVREAVITNGGPTDWALPFWDYEHNPVIPWVFRQQFMNDGQPNPLFVNGRDPSLAEGAALFPSETNWVQARSAQIFAARNSSEIGVSFGGPPTGMAFFGSGFGALEQQPHNVIHVVVDGLMRNPRTAGFDPLFWLHHCNIDRLWEIWNREGGANTNDSNWLGQRFEFFDVSGSPTTDINNAVLDIEADLNLTYEGLPEFSGGLVDGDFSEIPSMPAEMIGANADSVTLSTGKSSVDVALEAPVGPGLLTGDGGDGDGPSRVYLVIDNVQGDANPTVNYEVILDMGTPDDTSDDFVVGVAGFFGLVEAADVDNDDAPHGLTFTYDITTVVDRLQSQGLWDDQLVKVSFRAIREKDTPEITIGGVRIYVE